MRGRKPLAPELRLLKGGGNGRKPRARGLVVENPASPIAGEPKMPPEFDERDAAKWHEVVDLLREQGTLGRENGDVIRLYVIAYRESVEARKHLREHGPIVPAPRTGVPMHNPYRTVALSAEAVLVKLQAELGMTPASRSRVAKGPGSAKVASPWDALGNP